MILNRIFHRCRNLDRNYFKRWLLRDTSQEADIKLLQALKKINTQSAMKVHGASKGLIPNVSALSMSKVTSDINLEVERSHDPISEHVATKLVEIIE